MICVHVMSECLQTPLLCAPSQRSHLNTHWVTLQPPIPPTRHRTSLPTTQRVRTPWTTLPRQLVINKKIHFLLSDTYRPDMAFENITCRCAPQACPFTQWGGWNGGRSGFTCVLSLLSQRQNDARPVEPTHIWCKRINNTRITTDVMLLGDNR